MNGDTFTVVTNTFKNALHTYLHIFMMSMQSQFPGFMLDCNYDSDQDTVHVRIYSTASMKLHHMYSMKVCTDDDLVKFRIDATDRILRIMDR